jgi:peptide/nickel transport system permease protein
VKPFAVQPPCASQGQTEPVPHPSAHGDIFIFFIKSPSGILGSFLLLLILAMAVLGPWVSAADPFDIAGPPFAPPGTENLFGTDYLGRDILAGILAGGRTTLTIGIAAALIAVFIGLAIGALSGYLGGEIDTVLMKITEFFQILPPLLFAMVLVTIFSPSISTIVLAIGVVSWPGVARLTRAEFIRLREREYVKSVIAAGATNGYVMCRTILPNALPLIIVSAAFAVGSAILFEGGLSFLGLSDPNRMSWGLLIGQNKNYILSAWWTVVIPGAAIFLAVLSVSLISDGINDALTPQLRKRYE